MGSLADQIENYLKKLLKNSDGVVEVQRGALAEIFMCVPSQINYVLGTRFQPQNGYLVESKRGGGGFVRIVRLSLDPNQELGEMITALGDQPISWDTAIALLERLVSEDFLTYREIILLKSLAGPATLSLPQTQEDLLRGRILRSILISILRDDFK